MTSCRLFVLLVALTALCIVFHESPAYAGSFQVNPVNLTLSSGITNGLLAIRNQGDDAVRVQVSVFTWNQRADGEMDLAPTHDLVFFPSIVSLGPHEVRNVRVGVASEGLLATAVVEKTYRIIVEELLPVIKASYPDAVRVLTRMSIPVFVQTAPTKPVPRIEGLEVRGRVAAFTLSNAGSAHFVAHKIRLQVTGADKNVLVDVSVDGWYVLAQGARAYTVTLPPAACATGASITVAAETDHGPARQHIDSSCAP